MTTRVTIVIPTFNRSDLLEECLTSIRAQQFTGHEVVVVDDGSSEDVTAFAAAKFPEIQVVRRPQNGGFAAAANTGLRHARGELVFLLNNDMTLDEDCLARLVETLDKHQAGMAAPLVLCHGNADTVFSAGDRQRAGGRPESIGFQQALEGFSGPETIFGASGGAALYRRRIFDAVGYLDERFVAYFEDGDLNFRARMAGFSAVLALEAKARHVGSASMGTRRAWRARQCYRNHALLVAKNYPLTLLVRFGPAIILERMRQARRVLTTARAEAGLLRAWLQLAAAMKEVWSLIPHILRGRYESWRLRTISTRDLAKLLTK